MLCQRCQQKPATVHVTKIINGQKTELYLCQDCAKELEPQLSFSIAKFLSSLLDQISEPSRGESMGGRVCKKCGLTFQQFQKIGRLGCPACYRHLASQLDPLIRRIQGASRHRGKVPRKLENRRRVRLEIERLRDKLQQLIAKEEYEKAADVRDRIRYLEDCLRSQGCNL